MSNHTHPSVTAAERATAAAIQGAAAHQATREGETTGRVHATVHAEAIDAGLIPREHAPTLLLGSIALMVDNARTHPDLYPAEHVAAMVRVLVTTARARDIL